MTPSQSNVSRGAVLLMAAGALVLLAIIFTATWLASTTAALSAQVLQARQVRIAASEVLVTLLNAETGQRGYLLTGNGRYLKPFDTARADIARNLDRLDGLERGNHAIADDMRRLRLSATQKMAELEQTILLTRAGHRDQALALVRTDRGINAMDDAQTVLNDIISDAETSVSVNLDALNGDARLLRLVSLIGGVLVLIFAGAALFIVVRAINSAVRARAEVEQLNTSLEERVVRRTEALTRANEEIQRFAYIVSHDLRAPLVNIMGFTSELEVGANTLGDYFQSDAGENRAAAREAAVTDLPEAVKFIRSSTGKMDRLINAILKLSREGRRELAAEKVDLGKLFETIAASLRHQIEETSTIVEINPNLPMLRSDRLALEQVFSNLFDNALKYLKPGRPGYIAVTGENAGSSVVITVKDNGRGIAEQDQERVFELFRRAGRQDRPGEGIGLAHVRALVRRLGGDITLVSQLGEGSQFRVLLPRSLPSDTGIRQP